MKASTRSALRQQLEHLRSILTCFAEQMDGERSAGLVTELKPGGEVQFKSRGRMLTGTIGQISEDGEKLYVYVQNEDGFGTTGFRVLRSAVQEPEVDSGLSEDEEIILGRLLKVRLEV